jgi:ankyrin repeat protein
MERLKIRSEEMIKKYCVIIFSFSIIICFSACVKTQTQKIQSEPETQLKEIDNSTEEDLLIEAIAFSKVEIVKKIIADGINISFFYDDPNTSDYEDRYTPLYYAVKYCNSPIGKFEDAFEILKMLLEAGCDPNIGVYEEIPQVSSVFSCWYIDGGITPVMMSILPNVTQLLLDYGADLNYQDQYGRTALMLHSFFSNYDANDSEELLMKSLLDNGARINITDNTGKTALHYAIWGVNRRGIALLLKYNADINIKDDNGLSPLVVAHSRYTSSEVQNKMIELLINHGAKLENSDEEKIREWKELSFWWPDDLHISYSDR